MICPFCGVQVDGSFEFCTNCGNTLPKNHEYAQAPSGNANEPVYENVNVELNDYNVKQYISGVKPSFILGIISIALAVATNYIGAGLPAIICGIISLIKLKNLPVVFPEYISDPIRLAQYQAAAKKASLSKKLSIAGIVVAIVIDILLVVVGLAIILFWIGVPAVFIFLEEFM